MILKQPGGVPRLQVLGQDQHPDVRVGAADLFRRDQALVGVGGRHLDVDDRHVGMFGGHDPEELLGVADLAGNVHAGVFEEAGCAFPDQHGVVGDHAPHGISARMVIPPFAPCRTWSWPFSAPTRSARSVSLASSWCSGLPAASSAISTTSRFSWCLASSVTPLAAASVAMWPVVSAMKK